MSMEDILESKIADQQVTIFWLGQNSFIFKTHGGSLIALDPYFSRASPKEIYVHAEPPIRPEEVRVDYVFCTHDHSDHTDPDTLPMIAESSPKAFFLGSKESYDHFLRMGISSESSSVLSPGLTRSFGDFTVTTFFSVPPGEETTTHYGYLFDFGGSRIYNMGDSSAGVTANPEPVLMPVARIRPDIAIFPIIGDYPGRKPEDAFRFARIVRPKIVIPSHYECFANRTIDPEEFTRLFADTSEIRPVVIGYAEKYLHSW